MPASSYDSCDVVQLDIAGVFLRTQICKQSVHPNIVLVIHGDVVLDCSMPEKISHLFGKTFAGGAYVFPEAAIVIGRFWRDLIVIASPNNPLWL